MDRINLTEVLAASRAGSEAPCFVGPGFQLSYGQLDRAVRRHAAALERDGVRCDDRVLIAMDDGPQLVLSCFATLAVGAVPILVNPRADAASIAQYVDDAAPALCIGQAASPEIWPAAVQARLRLPEAGAWRAWTDGTHPDDGWNNFARKPADAPALIQYTSGSTGRPKGVVHSAAGILATCRHVAVGQLGLHAGDLLYSVPKTFFGYGMGNSLLFPLHAGAAAVLDGAWPSAERVESILQQFRPTVLFAVPTLYRVLLDHGLTGIDLSIRLAFSAGAPLSKHLAAQWRERTGLELHDGIGATEMCHVFATTYPDALAAGSVGRMLPGWEARIVDAQGQAVPAGECGVLLVKGPGRALGYWQRPAEDRTRFAGDWYRTGDLFVQDEQGLLTFHGREDDRFKVNGRWVSPVEIENLLVSLVPELREAYVLPVRDRNGEDRPALALRALPVQADQDAGEDLLRSVKSVLEAHLDSYKRPATILMVDDIPLNRNGKPDRRALARLAQTAFGAEQEENVC